MLNRRQSREEVFGLVFETGFNFGENINDVYALALTSREIEENEYIKNCFFGINEHLEEIDGYIEKYSRGWKRERISRVAIALMRVCIYEMLYMKDVPVNVSLNEAIEISKKYDDDGASAFVNGVLNSVKEEISKNE